MSEKPVFGRFAHRWRGLVLGRVPGGEVITDGIALVPYDSRRP